MPEPLLPVTVRVNARLQEAQLAEAITGLLADLLARVSPGSLVLDARLETGPHGEPRAALADLMVVPAEAEDVLTAIFDLGHGLPRGSTITINDRQAPFGELAGVALYLNGTQLDPEVYAAGDLQATADALTEAVGETGRLWAHWSGPAETALYFYGPDAAALRARLETAVPEQPLLTRSRMVALTPPA